MNWRHYVRSHLPPLDVSAEREVRSSRSSRFSSNRSTSAPAPAARPMTRRVQPGAEPKFRTGRRSRGRLARIERPYVQPPAAGAGSGGFMTGFIQDIRYALRALKRAPGFAAVSIITLALGIARHDDRVFDRRRHPAAAAADRRSRSRDAGARNDQRRRQAAVAWPNYRRLARAADLVRAARRLARPDGNLTGIDQPRRLMSPARDLESALDARRQGRSLGRDFTADDDQSGVDANGDRQLRVLAARAWRHAGGDRPPHHARRIAGHGDRRAAARLHRRARRRRVPAVRHVLRSAARRCIFGRGNHFGLAAIGRLKPGVSVDAANAEMETIARQLEQEYPATNSGNSATARPLFETLVGTARPMLYVLLGAVVTMLLIACVNLANLMLARAAGRTQEMAVRRSLGAARWRIARQMLTESLLLAHRRRYRRRRARLRRLRGDRRAAAAESAAHPHHHDRSGGCCRSRPLASIGTGVLFGLMPAIQAATGRSMTLLRSARVTGTAHAGAGTRRTLLLAEVALALVLVTGAGLMLRTMNNLSAIDTGFTQRADRHGAVQPAAALRPRRSGWCFSISRSSACARSPA